MVDTNVMKDIKLPKIQLSKYLLNQITLVI